MAYKPHKFNPHKEKYKKIRKEQKKREKEDAMVRGYQWIKFWHPRPVKENVEKAKWREFLLDQNFDRPPVPAERLVVGFLALNETYEKCSLIDFLYLMHIERYEFFTIRHLSNLGLFKKPNDIPIREFRSVYEKVMKLQRLGLVWQPIRDWDLDDAEFKQRFGEQANRHQYKKRYALNSAGKVLLNRFYEIVCD